MGYFLLLQGVTSHGSFMAETGYVWHTGEGSTTLAVNKENKENVVELLEVLNKAGIRSNTSENLDSLVWGKLIVNAGINPLTALLRVRNGVLAERENYKEILCKTVDEGATVAKARGLYLFLFLFVVFFLFLICSFLV
jgi:2-dehydropantoate 2-reductase